MYKVNVSSITAAVLGLNLVDNNSIHDLAGDPLVQGNTTASFATAVNFSTGAAPRGVGLVDVNGDGIPDEVTAITGAANVSVLLGNGNGTFQAAHNFPTATEPFFLAVADVQWQWHSRPNHCQPQQQRSASCWAMATAHSHRAKNFVTLRPPSP